MEGPEVREEVIFFEIFFVEILDNRVEFSRRDAVTRRVGRSTGWSHAETQRRGGWAGRLDDVLGVDLPT